MELESESTSDVLTRATLAVIRRRHDPDSGLGELCELICADLDADLAQVYVIAPDDVHLRSVAIASPDPGLSERIVAVLEEFPVRLDASIAGRAVTSPVPVVLRDIQALEGYDPGPGYQGLVTREGITQLVGVAIRSARRDLGSLLVARRGAAPPFTDAEVARLLDIAAVGELALERAALLARVERQADILDRIGDAVIVVDEGRVVTKWNHGAEVLYGIPRDEALGAVLGELLTTVSHREAELSSGWADLHADRAWSDVVRQVTRYGRIVDVDVSVSPITHGTGFAGAIAVNRDVSARVKAQAALAERQAFAESVLDALPGRTCVVAADGMVRAVNDRYRLEGPFGEGAGSGPDVGASAVDYLTLRSAAATGLATVLSRLQEVLEGRPAPVYGPLDVLTADDRWTSCEVVPFHGAGGGALVSFADSTERKQNELELVHRATHDSLTALPNRALLIDRLREALARSHRRGDLVAVLFVDLDDFKSINDGFGHGVGDRVLVDVAARLLAACRASDTVARVGGDEFVVVLEEVETSQEADARALRILGGLADLTPGGERVGMGASIGVAVANGQVDASDRDVENLIRSADLAMLRAKRAGKARVVVQGTSPGGRQSDTDPTDG